MKKNCSEESIKELCNFTLYAGNVQTKSSVLLTYRFKQRSPSNSASAILRGTTLLKKKKSSRRTDLFFIISGGSRKCVCVRFMGEIMPADTTIQTLTSIKVQRFRQKYGIEQTHKFMRVASFNISFYHLSRPNIFGCFKTFSI